MNSRVSASVPATVKSLRNTLPTGKSKWLLVPSTVMRWPLGNASQRDLAAPSDQNGAFGAYGIMPLDGSLGFELLAQPVCDSRPATLPPPPPPEGTILWISPDRPTKYNSCAWSSPNEAMLSGVWNSMPAVSCSVGVVSRA